MTTIQHMIPAHRAQYWFDNGIQITLSLSTQPVVHVWAEGPYICFQVAKQEFIKKFRPEQTIYVFA